MQEGGKTWRAWSSICFKQELSTDAKTKKEKYDEKQDILYSFVVLPHKILFNWEGTILTLRRGRDRVRHHLIQVIKGDVISNEANWHG